MELRRHRIRIRGDDGEVVLADVLLQVAGGPEAREHHDAVILHAEVVRVTSLPAGNLLPLVPTGGEHHAAAALCQALIQAAREHLLGPRVPQRVL